MIDPDYNSTNNTKNTIPKNMFNNIFIQSHICKQSDTFCDKFLILFDFEDIDKNGNNVRLFDNSILYLLVLAQPIDPIHTWHQSFLRGSAS